MIYIYVYMYDYMTYLYYIYVCMYIHICVYTYIFFLSIAQSQSPLQLLHQIHSDMIPRIAQCHSTELLTSEGMDSGVLITSSGRANLFLLLSILLSLLLLFHFSKVWYLKWAPVHITDVVPGSPTGAAESSQ